MRSSSLPSLRQALFGAQALLLSSCAGTVTPPDSTPVYADEIAPGVEPIAVERSSVSNPELDTVSGNSQKQAGRPTEAQGSEADAEPKPKEGPSDEKKVEDDDAQADKAIEGEKPTDGAVEASPKAEADAKKNPVAP